MPNYGLFRKIAKDTYKCVVTTSDHQLACQLKVSLPDIDLLMDVDLMVKTEDGLFIQRNYEPIEYNWCDPFDYP